MMDGKLPREAGKHGFDGACAPGRSGTTGYTFSVGVFPWIPKKGRPGVKRGKVVVRVSGSTSEVEKVYAEAEKVALLLDDGRYKGPKSFDVQKNGSADRWEASFNTSLDDAQLFDAALRAKILAAHTGRPQSIEDARVAREEVLRRLALPRKTLADTCVGADEYDQVRSENDRLRSKLAAWALSWWWGEGFPQAMERALCACGHEALDHSPVGKEGLEGAIVCLSDEATPCDCHHFRAGVLL